MNEEKKTEVMDTVIKEASKKGVKTSEFWVVFIVVVVSNLVTILMNDPQVSLYTQGGSYIAAVIYAIGRVLHKKSVLALLKTIVDSLQHESKNDE